MTRPALNRISDTETGQDAIARLEIPMDRLTGRPLLLMLDVDGTLAPIAPTPSMARVPDETRRVIESLVACPGVFVVLVSGRAAHEARQMVGVDRLWAVGNHGAEVIAPNGEVTVDPSVARYANAMTATARVLEPAIHAIEGATLENKTWSLTVHYRAASDDVLPGIRTAVEQAAAASGLRVTEGKKILEVRPPVEIHKGTAVAHMAHSLGGDSPSASLLFAGDDVTDEDAFRLLRLDFPRAVTIHIGDGAGFETAAEFRITDLRVLRDLLSNIEANARRQR